MRCEAKNEKHWNLTNPPPTNWEWKLPLPLSPLLWGEIHSIKDTPAIYSSSSPSSYSSPSSTFTFVCGSSSVRLPLLATHNNSNIHLSSISSSSSWRRRSFAPRRSSYSPISSSVCVVVVVFLFLSPRKILWSPFLFFSTRRPPLCVRCKER